MQNESKNPKRKEGKFVYNTHADAWGCIYYEKNSGIEAVVMVNETNRQGLTRKIAGMLKAGTL